MGANFSKIKNRMPEYNSSGMERHNQYFDFKFCAARELPTPTSCFFFAMSKEVLIDDRTQQIWTGKDKLKEESGNPALKNFTST
jgi:hypothetical protein